MNTEQPTAARSFLSRTAVFLAKPFQYAVFRYIKLHPVLAHQPVY
nr:MAG TPA: hypothetical protein [Caudoviricetes sp.]